MCGLCGMLDASHLNKGETQIFKDLLLLSALRGMSSTGVVALRSIDKKRGKKVEVLYQKDTKNSFEFLNEPKYNGLYENMPKVLMGHTRFPTAGEVTKANAHPFNFSNIIGMHNGVIRGTFEHSLEFQTDSEGLYNLIDQYGIDEALNKVNQEAWSMAYALQWFDKKTRTLNFIRSKDRPLFFAVNHTNRQMYWASESGFLNAVLERRNITKKEGSPYYYEPNVLLSIPITEPDCISKATTRQVEIKAKVYPKSTYHYNNRTHHHTPPVIDNFDRYPDLSRHYKLPNSNITISAFQLQQLLNDGCVCCGSVFDSEDIFNKVDIVHWGNSRDFVCNDCVQKEPEIADIFNLKVEGISCPL